MRFASVYYGEQPQTVVIEGDQAIPLRGIAELGPATPLSLLCAAERDRQNSHELAELVFRPVVPSPRRIICVGLNYAAHAQEAGRDAQDEYPVLFTKFASCLVGAFDEIRCPPESVAIDYEGEIAVVIGERARRVSRERALESVAGVTVGNDVTMRDYQNKTHQWLQGKSWDRTTPLGPALVTLDEIGDLDRLTLRTIVNGQTVQEATSDLMIFDVPSLVSTISAFTELEPGDVILTGTPSGVGFRREPPLLLGPGDVVRVELDGAGYVENRFVAE